LLKVPSANAALQIASEFLELITGPFARDVVRQLPVDLAGPIYSWHAAPCAESHGAGLVREPRTKARCALCGKEIFDL
jgi:hypothetical protein